MRQGQHGIALATPPGEAWPPDDTEESVVGTNLHQEAITTLRNGLNAVAGSLTPVGAPPSWYALSQTGLGGLHRPDGSDYKVLPDVFVYDHAIDALQATLALAVEGPPRLIVEVLSETTQERDRDMAEGKGYSYARAGVSEYLLLDPAGEFLPGQAQGQGWRLEQGAYVPWRPEADGRWHSEQLGVAFGFEGVHVAVYDGDGRRQLREGEVGRTVRALEERLARQEAEIAMLRRFLDERRRK